MGTGPSQPRRIVTRLLVFLLLGAAVNVAVAWAIACQPLTESIFDYMWNEQGLDPPLGNVVAYSASTNSRSRLRTTLGLGRWILAVSNSINPEKPLEIVIPEWANGRCWPISLSDEPGVNFRQTDSQAVGWPLLSMWGSQEVDYQVPAADPVMRSIWSIPLESPKLQVGGAPVMRFLPIGILWPGFAVNTIFYAAPLWLLWALSAAGTVAFRRMRRRKRGLCVHCAYDLRGAAPDSLNCPECGEPRVRLES